MSQDDKRGWTWILYALAGGGFWFGARMLKEALLEGLAVMAISLAVLIGINFRHKLIPVFNRLSGKEAREVAATEEGIIDRHRRGHRLAVELAGKWRRFRATKFQDQQIAQEMLEIVNQMIYCLEVEEQNKYRGVDFLRAHERIYHAVMDGKADQNLEKPIQIVCERFKVEL